MNSIDVKIGDFVYWGNQIVKILTMDFFHCTVLDVKNDVIPLVDYKELTPIPMSEDILKKNGYIFSVSNNDYLISFPNNKDFQIFLSDGEFYLRSHVDSNELFVIDYIHELQHILWSLCLDVDLKIF